MAPPLTGQSLILHPRILPNGAGADTIGAVHRDMPERSVAPGSLGRRTKEVTMTTTRVALVLLCLMTGTAMSQQVTELLSKDLPEHPGKEMLMITVEHAPGGSSPIHVHNAHALVYILGIFAYPPSCGARHET